jgi:hypothetical protein
MLEADPGDKEAHSSGTCRFQNQWCFTGILASQYLLCCVVQMFVALVLAAIDWQQWWMCVCGGGGGGSALVTLVICHVMDLFHSIMCLGFHGQHEVF